MIIIILIIIIIIIIVMIIIIIITNYTRFHIDHTAESLLCRMCRSKGEAVALVVRIGFMLV